MLSETFIWQAAAIGCGLLVAALAKPRRPRTLKGFADDVVGIIGIVLFYALLTSGQGCSSPLWRTVN
jgi:hypothetical protein